jgi:hypothetical protein
VLKILHSLFFLIVFFLFSLALFFSVRSLYRLVTWSSTNGEIITLEERSSQHRIGGIRTNYLIKPTVRFMTPDGEEHYVSSSGDYRNYSVGQIVPVRYPQIRPGKGAIDTFGERWGLTLALAAFALFFSIPVFFLGAFVRGEQETSYRRKQMPSIALSCEYTVEQDTSGKWLVRAIVPLRERGGTFTAKRLFKYEPDSPITQFGDWPFICHYNPDTPERLHFLDYNYDKITEDDLR